MGKRWDAYLTCSRQTSLDGEYILHTGNPDDGAADGHYFAVNHVGWRTSEDLSILMKLMEKEKYPYEVVWVPLALNTDYAIVNYLPDVEGRLHIFSKGGQ